MLTPVEDPETGAAPDKSPLSDRVVSQARIKIDLPVGAKVTITVETTPSEDGEGRVVISNQENSRLLEGTAVVIPMASKVESTVEGLQATSQLDAAASVNSAAADGLTMPGRQALSGFEARLRSAGRGLVDFWRARPLEMNLFFLALLVYFLTRLVGLADWPIYFFTDEAVQTVMASEFVRDGLRNYDGEYFPTYFNKDPTYNLSSVSVYLQVIPYLLFGKSVLVTRLVSVAAATFAAVVIGLMLRNIFKIPYWWSGVLLFSIAPAWFLHSRTAFETVEMVSFYAGFLYFYLLYRYRSPRFLYVALVMGALTFYTYSPGQVLILLTGILLLLSDFRYHWQNRAVALRGLLLLCLLGLPYLRFYIGNPEAPLRHLTTRASYWLEPVPFDLKLSRLASEYLYGLNPLYWFFPNKHDLDRHLMQGYGHLLLVTLPFFLIGLGLSIWKIRSSAHRAVLIALIASPSGSALVGIGITRILVFIVPATVLMALGLSQCLDWLERLLIKLHERWKMPARLADADLLRTWISVGLAVILIFANIAMLRDALTNGPTWYQDYTLGGMQYGAQQLFRAVQDYLKEHPEREMIVSPSWTNGADVVKDFFLPAQLPVRMGSVDGHIFQHLPLDENTVFVMIPGEYERVLESRKFTDIHLERTLYYPNGEPGFYFVRLNYVEDIDNILATEKEQRQQLQQGEVVIDGQVVPVGYSMLDMGQIENVFDGNRVSVARTLEANPFVIELDFPEPRSLSGITALIGSLHGRLVAKVYPEDGAAAEEFVTDFKGSVSEPEVNLDFEVTILATRLRLEFFEPGVAEPAHIHVWEIYLNK